MADGRQEVLSDRVAGVSADVWVEYAQLLAKSCSSLDEGRFGDYLGLYAADAEYSVHAYSPELGREMTWLRTSIAELADLLDKYPKHVVDPAQRRHMYCVSRVSPSGGEATGRYVAEAVIAIWRTLPDGASSPYLVGRYVDEMALGGPDPAILSRSVLLDTRVLSVGSHLPV